MSDQPAITLVIDGVEVAAPQGMMLVDAAKHGDIEIPVFCYEPKLGHPVGACRMCMVEIEGIPKLQTACSTPVRDGMVVYTQNERVKEAQNAVGRYTDDVAALEIEITTVEAAYEKTSGELQSQLAAVKDERATATSGMPEDLMTLYEKLRAQKGGVGAAALRRRECGGCRLTLNASDLGIIAKQPSDEVIRCEECNRILVRTGESGL